jgi:hypothetical protein
MPFDFFENTTGNVLPNTKNNLRLIKEYKKIKNYPERIQFWDFHQLIHINYVLRDTINYINNIDTIMPNSNFDISPESHSEWILYYEWQRNKLLEQQKIEFINTVNNFTAISQKVEYKDYRLNEIEQKLKILNPNAMNNPSRDAKYAYDCEVKGEIPRRKQFNLQTDTWTIQGGVLYHLKHFISNYEFSNRNDFGLSFSDIFYNKSVELKSIELFKELKVIDANCNFIYESKGFWGFWLDYCLTKGLVKKMKKVQYRNILVNEFKGLKLTDKFTEYPSKASIENSYSLLDKKTLMVDFTAKYSGEFRS